MRAWTMEFAGTWGGVAATGAAGDAGVARTEP
jgi:hypothetical protein